MTEDDPVNPILGKRLLHDTGIGVDIEDVAHVQRVRHADDAGPDILSYVVEKIIGQLREFESIAVDRVGQQHRLPAGAPQDGEPRPLDDGKRKDLEALHHLREVLHAMNPRLPEGRRDDFVVPGQRRRVKACGVIACGVRVGLQGDERLLG